MGSSAHMSQARLSAVGALVMRRSSLWPIVVGLLLVAACSDSSSASTSGPTATTSVTESSPSAVTEEDPGAASPVTTASLPPAGATTCGDPKAHVYSPDRLRLLAACVTVTGTVAVIRSEKDGDLHLLLRLDPGQDQYLNEKNVSAEQGDLVLEPVCVRSPTQADAVAACAGYANPLPIPGVGTHVSVTGPWVLDLDHGWQEIHPVFAFNGVGAPPTANPVASALPPSTPTPAPAPPPTAASVVNLCGAPSNPWNYNFCGGNTITAPDPAICSYFHCIASFWNGTGYVVQCMDGTFSKSGGHTGVCSTHGGFGRNLYSP